MSATAPSTVAERRAILVARLRAQRYLIEARLAAPVAGHAAFPRSVTMRALTQRPGVFMHAAWDLLALWHRGRRPREPE